MTNHPDATADAWRRLGSLLIQRRTALNPEWHNRSAFSEATGLSYRLVYDAEEARRVNFGASTLAALEAAYRLEPGSIRIALDGGDLIPRGEPVPQRLAPGMRAVLDGTSPGELEPFARVAEMQVTAAEHATGRPWRELSGAEIFDRPADAALWDDTAPALQRDVAVMMIARMRRERAKMGGEAGSRTA